MKKILLFIISLLIFVGCKPSPHPRHPDYAIRKPVVKYKTSKVNLKKMEKELQGSPYVWAEEGPYYFDCSGFTYYMYGSMGVEIPRVARNQAKVGKKIEVENLKYGDLLFFDTDRHRRGKVTHVGMYVGNGWFTHASTGIYEVKYSKLTENNYYRKRLKVCRRYVNFKNNSDVKVWDIKKIKKSDKQDINNVCDIEPKLSVEDIKNIDSLDLL